MKCEADHIKNSFILFREFSLIPCSKESAYITKIDRLAQSTKYLETGPNWENALLLFLFSLFLVVPLLKARAALILLLHFPKKIIFASSVKFVGSPCCIYSLLHFKLITFCQLYIYSINNIRHNKFSQYLSSVLIFFL